MQAIEQLFARTRRQLPTVEAPQRLICRLERREITAVPDGIRPWPLGGTCPASSAWRSLPAVPFVAPRQQQKPYVSALKAEAMAFRGASAASSTC